jgi:hypothetical protein
MQLLDNLKERRGHWKLKEEALDRSLQRPRFGRVHEPVRKTDYGMNENSLYDMFVLKFHPLVFCLGEFMRICQVNRGQK